MNPDTPFFYYESRVYFLIICFISCEVIIKIWATNEMSEARDIWVKGCRDHVMYERGGVKKIGSKYETWVSGNWNICMFIFTYSIQIMVNDGKYDL